MNRGRTPEYEVDHQTGCWDWQRAKNRAGYGIRRDWLAHRWAYTQAYGEIPSGKHVEHICRNPGCVNPEHLRLATDAENAQNRSPHGNRGSRSRYRGVYYMKRTGRWIARATLAGEAHYLGSFGTEDEAAEIVIAWRREHMPFSECDRVGAT